MHGLQFGGDNIYCFHKGQMCQRNVLRCFSEMRNKVLCCCHTTRGQQKIRGLETPAPTPLEDCYRVEKTDPGRDVIHHRKAFHCKLFNVLH